MMTPAELRKKARWCRSMAETEANIYLRRRLAGHALALALLAEKIDRQEEKQRQARIAAT